VSAQEFLNQRAVNVMVDGHYSLANWYDHHGNRREFACRTTRVSPFRMLVSVPVVGKVGERVVSYFGDFGKLDGWIADTVAGGFLIDLETDREQPEKLARKLTWLEKKQKDPSVIEARNNGRIIPKTLHSTVIFADGTYRDCFIIDMSASGAAVSADVRPDLGMPLAIGSCVGRVVRHFREGFAIKFVDAQNEAQLERLVARPSAPAAERAAAGRARPARSADLAGLIRALRPICGPQAGLSPAARWSDRSSCGFR